MPNVDYSTLLDEVGKRQSLVKSYLFSEEHRLAFDYQHLEDAVYSYIKAGGKSLRPAVLMFSCGAVGGDERRAVPAAASIELYHTFTLVHDDIIDRDTLRRGSPTVHVEFSEKARKELGYEAGAADHYGMSVAILAGDLQQGWASALLPRLHEEFQVPAELALNLVAELFGRVQLLLVRGETLDILFSQMPIEKLSQERVIEMLWQKTGVLYEYAGRAGAAIGLNQPDLRDKQVEMLANFTGKCGIAFQIQDDILGVVGNEAQLGKKVGSDIREGKRTLIVLGSLPNMTPAQRQFALSVLGNQEATHEQIQEVTDLLRTAGGIDQAYRIAQGYIQEGLAQLDRLPESHQKDLLKAWATYLIERKF